MTKSFMYVLLYGVIIFIQLTDEKLNNLRKTNYVSKINYLYTV